MEISSIDAALRLGREFKASCPLQWVCNVSTALYRCGTVEVKTRIPWLCSCCWCWGGLARTHPALGLRFQRSGGEKKTERFWQRGGKVDRGVEHAPVKSLRELDLFSVVRKTLRGDLIAPLFSKYDKTKHGSDRRDNKGQGQQITAWQVLLGYSE